MSTCMRRRRRRRSVLSATAPPTNEPRIRGPSSARLTRPTCNDEWVRWKTWYGTATRVSWVPTKLISWPTYRRRKSDDSRRGVMSASRRGTTEDGTRAHLFCSAAPQVQTRTVRIPWARNPHRFRGRGTAGSALGQGAERLVDDYEKLLDARLHGACPLRVRFPVGPGQRRREHVRHHSLFRQFPRKTG